jgi:hypothetical protein
VRTLIPDEIEELYDLENDPDEMHNLALDPDCDSLLADYRASMTADLTRTQAGLLNNLPPIRAISDSSLPSTTQSTTAPAGSGAGAAGRQ